MGLQVFAMMAFKHPHVLLFDEPTNHLDMQCIDALADAIKNFNGEPCVADGSLALR